MRLKGPVDTSDIEDRRGLPGGGRGVAIGGGGLGIVGIVIYLLMNVLGGGGGSTFDVNQPGGFPAMPGTSETAPALSCPQGASTSEECFVAGVVGDVQRSWAAAFQRDGRTYERTKLVLFSGSTTSGCGTADAATGPFYCPADRKVYLDLSFFQELKDRFQAPGDFAQAYVIAHEIGHHVQNLLGIESQVRNLMTSHPDQRNELSVRLELQADCFAGVWAHSAYSELDSGDIDEGLAAAKAVGDDRLQRDATGTVDPDSFTHGTSAQRSSWFSNGYRGGDVNACDTFSGDI
jgi:predicted metalloprotease